MSRLEGSRWRLRWAREMPLAMEFEWGFFRPLFGGQTCMWALPRVWRREADTTSCVADYLTRSVRRASGFVLVARLDRKRLGAKSDAKFLRSIRGVFDEQARRKPLAFAVGAGDAACYGI